MTRQTYDRAPRLTKLATAHISKGDNVIFFHHMQTSTYKSSQHITIQILTFVEVNT